MSSQAEQSSFKALLFSSSSAPPSVTSLPLPTTGAGTALVRPLLAPIVHYSNEIFLNGNPRGYSYPLPIVPGTSAIAQLFSPPPDAPTLLDQPPNSLCWIDPVIRARDDSGNTSFLHGLSGSHSARSRVLMDGEWRNGTYAEVAKVPVENVHLLNRRRLLGKREEGGLNYSLADLCSISNLLVAYGGLADVEVRPGDIVVVAPATGAFGSAAVHVALAMGADIVAMGRNEQSLQELRSLDPQRVKTVKISGDVEKDRAAILLAAERRPDVYFDISPPAAAKSSHIMAGILSVRKNGRMSFMGGAKGAIDFPYRHFVINNLTLKGTFMYTEKQVDEFIRMVEAGRLRLGSAAGMRCAGIFELEEWKDAFEIASRDGGRPGRFAAFCPNGRAILESFQ